MATIAEALATLRSSVSEFSEDSRFTDSYLYSIWKLSRARMLNQRINRHRRINYWNTAKFCLELAPAKSHECPCIEWGCDAARSVHPLPRVLEAQRLGSLIRVEDLSGHLIPRKSEAMVRTDRHDPIKSGKPAYYISNQHVVVLNAPNRKVIQVQGVWEDPVSWKDVHYCVDEEHPCPDVWKMDTLLDAYLEEAALRNALELLGAPTKKPEDVLINRNDQI